MKRGMIVTAAALGGLLAGGVAAWTVAGKGFGRADIVNGPWTTSLSFGTTKTDAATRASVARRGLLALPSTETVYWQASVDSDGRPLSGSCSYVMTGTALDARWWSVTYYDKAGFLVANPANIWSFSGANLSKEDTQNWRVKISPDKPAAGHWLPSKKGQPFDLTLRMYNPGGSFRVDPAIAALPALKREACA